MRRTMAEPTIRPSATGASCRTCSGWLMPKPMQIGSGVCSRSQPTLSIRLCGNCGPLAGDAGHRDVVQETRSSCSAIRSARSRGVVGVTSCTRLKSACAADLGQLAGFFDRQVGHDRPGDPGRLGVGDVLLPVRGGRRSRS